MLLFALAYVGGVLTILSPCILPVLPFVFARADRPFLRSGLPMLLGMAVSFAAVSTLAAVTGEWASVANERARYAAMALMAVFGLMLVLPSLAERLTRPLVQLGGRLSARAAEGDARGNIGASALLGVATGLLWAPCAGPILGLVLTGAALQGANVQSTGLLLAYAAGSATSLALALLAGGRVFAAMKRSIGAGERVRQGLGVAVLAGVAAIALGLDTGLLKNLSTTQTTALEQGLLDRFHTPEPKGEAGPAMAMTGGAAMMAMRPAGAAAGDGGLPVEGQMPALDGAVTWFNSAPLTCEELKGKVVLVDFWTYSCINCLRALPYVQAWSDKYRDAGLVVIGVHAPEFAFEKKLANVEKAVADLGIDYPVAVDNDYAIWRAFDNRYWPAHYFIDVEGRVRHHHFGEGAYAQSEMVIQQLLREGGLLQQASAFAKPDAAGAQAPSDMRQVASPETYLGYARAENFVSPGGASHDAPRVYASAEPALNQWALAGDWTVAEEHAALNEAGGSIVYRFRARDLHLVLGPSEDGKPVRFRVTVDGQAPGDAAGGDAAADGSGTVTEQRLYQLIRQSGAVAERTFRIEFLDPGVQAYAFTFG